MKIDRMACVPLVVHDPYFSIWSPADHLYDADTMHWSQAPQRLFGHVCVDGQRFRFMGGEDGCPVIRQTSLEVTSTATTFCFESECVELKVRFFAPILLEDPALVSRPCTYLDFEVQRKQEVEVKLELTVTSDLVRDRKDKVVGGVYRYDSFTYGTMGKAFQKPLGHSGDRITIDWGQAYLAAEEDNVTISFDEVEGCLKAEASLGTEGKETSMILAYDDLASIFYFGDWQKAYWCSRYGDILHAIKASFGDKETVSAKAMEFDRQLEEKARAVGGEDYAFLCSISYRHVIGAHKLIMDREGKLLFLSKENDSNGCIGTVDVTYPSVPLFLLFNTEYVKGMLRPIFQFAQYPVWEFDFAPHDVGRYPYASGQVYGLDRRYENKGFCSDNGALFPFFYQFPAGTGIYDWKEQMPVEECGNMMILTAAVCELDGSGEFAEPYYAMLKRWAEYLRQYGADPGEQLCTDDFAGHMSHNVNLSAKAVLGIEAFGRIAALLGREDEAAKYHEEAVDMAKSWEARGFETDHYRLAFDRENSWSLKYNLVWDKFFGSGLFSQDVFELETAYYLKQSNQFGVPLDSRKSYTKSDWIMWCASFAPDREDARRLIAPVAEYVRTTNDRVPFSDWYETKDGSFCHFIARSVQGGIFMPLLMDMVAKR